VAAISAPIRLDESSRLPRPGETRRVTFELRPEQLAFTRADGRRGLEPGRFHVWVAPHSQSGLQGEFGWGG
jgi:beta-glucosidase